MPRIVNCALVILALVALAMGGSMAKPSKAHAMALRGGSVVHQTVTAHLCGAVSRTRTSRTRHNYVNRAIEGKLCVWTLDGVVTKVTSNSICQAKGAWHCKSGTRVDLVTRLSMGEVKLHVGHTYFREVNGNIDRTMQMFTDLCGGDEGFSGC